MNPFETARGFINQLKALPQFLGASIQGNKQPNYLPKDGFVFVPNDKFSYQVRRDDKSTLGVNQQLSPLPVATPVPNYASMPPDIGQTIKNVFDPYGETENAYSVLNHPNSQTYTKEEIAQKGKESWNRGENPDYKVKDIDIPNPDNWFYTQVEGDTYDPSRKVWQSTDRGLFRINNRTYQDMKSQPFWKSAMEKRGITSWDDLNDPVKNTNMAYLILARANWDSENSKIKDKPSWRQWYAAPLELRER